MYRSYEEEKRQEVINTVLASCAELSSVLVRCNNAEANFFKREPFWSDDTVSEKLFWHNKIGWTSLGDTTVLSNLRRRIGALHEYMEQLDVALKQIEEDERSARYKGER